MPTWLIVLIALPITAGFYLWQTVFSKKQRVQRSAPILKAAATVTFIAFVCYWSYHGRQRGRQQMEEEKNLVLHDKVVYTEYKEGEKVKFVTFAGGRVWQPPTLEFNNALLPDDSIVKRAGGFRFVIYKAATGDPIIIEDTPR